MHSTRGSYEGLSTPLARHRFLNQSKSDRLLGAELRRLHATALRVEQDIALPALAQALAEFEDSAGS